jgi:type IV pilus assembly protein PilE
MNSSHKGFTLTELMITVVVIGVLAAVAIPAYTKHVTRAMRTQEFSDLQTLVMFEERYFALNPTNVSGSSYINFAGLQTTFPQYLSNFVQSPNNYTLSIVRYNSTGALVQGAPPGGTQFYIYAEPKPTGRLYQDTEYPCPCIRSDGVKGITNNCKTHTIKDPIGNLDEVCITKEWK